MTAVSKTEALQHQNGYDVMSNGVTLHRWLPVRTCCRCRIRVSDGHHPEPPCHRQEGLLGPRQPVTFFTSQALDQRSGDLSSLLDGISNGVQAIQAANQGITSIQKLVDQAKSVANQAISTQITTTGTASTAFQRQHDRRHDHQPVS